MSRLDYITIAIVAACIVAIIFLVYKMTDLFGDSPTTEKIENVAGTVEEEGTSSDTYDYQTEDTADDETGDATTDDESTADGGGSSTDSEPATNGNSPSTDAGNNSTNSSSSDSSEKGSYSNEGAYMVIAGTYMKKANAVTQVRKLKRLGFENARVEMFDRGKFALALVDRFSSMSSAERLVKDLQAEDIKGYVKAKEAH